MNIANEAALRRQASALLVSVGMSPAGADEAVDLAFHAAARADDAARLVISQTPDHAIRLQALSLYHGVMRGLVEAAEAKVRQACQKHGVESENIVIGAAHS